MRVAFIVPEFPSVSQTFVLDQMISLIEAGHDLDIYAYREPKYYKTHDVIKRYKLIERTYYYRQFYRDIGRNKLQKYFFGILYIGKFIFKKPSQVVKSLNIYRYGRAAASLDLFLQIIPFLDKEPYDIIHCHFGICGLHANLYRILGALKGKIITTFHGYDVTAEPLKQGKDVYKELFRNGDLFTVNSDFIKNRIINLGCREDKIRKLPVGIDLSFFPFKVREASRGKKVRILTVGRLVEKKGIEYSIKAVAKVMDSYTHIEYFIVGDGPLRIQLETLIEGLGVEDKVKVLGWKNQHEIREFYSDADIFLLSSVSAKDGDSEGQGLVLVEAQAVGLPVVATLHNGFPDSVIDGKSAFLVPERDIEALAERLQHLIDHPGIWAEMGRVGRRYVEENFDNNMLNDQLIQLYLDLLGS